jgi:hypothetical protein
MSGCNRELTPGQEVRFRALLLKALHQLVEEKGELPTRAQLDLAISHNPLTDYDLLALGDDGQLHPVQKSLKQ